MFLSFFRKYSLSYSISYWPLCFLAVILLLITFDSHVHDALRFDHNAIAKGEYWRLISCHFVHLNWNHALLNGGGFLLLAWMQPKGHWLYWLVFYVISGFIISSLLQIQDDVMWYVGGSGVLHGLLMLAAFFSQWLENWRRWAMVVLITAKVIWEQTPLYSDEQVHTLIGGHVIVDAHFLGAACALLIILFYILKPTFSSKNSC